MYLQNIEPNRSGYLEVDDKKIYWEYFGEGKNEVICFFNGVAMFTRSWYLHLPRVFPEYDVILYDYLGQGNSTSKDEPYSVIDFVEYLVQILNELSVKKIHGIGISYGGIVASEFARLHQDRLHTLTISGTFLTRKEFFHFALDVTRIVLTKSPFEVFVKLIYANIFGEEFMKQMRPMFDTMKEKLYDRYKDRIFSLIRLDESQFEFLDNLGDYKSQYEQMKVPTLLLTGEYDRMVPVWWQKEMTEILPNIKMIVVENCGHVVYLERPDIFFDNALKLMKTKSINF